VIAHRRRVLIVWLLLAACGLAGSGAATKALSDQYTVPGHEGFETNAAITRLFGNGGDGAPLVAVVTVPAGRRADSAAAVARVREVAARVQQVVPGARIASYASTHNRSFVSADGRTTFLLAYARPENGSFGQSTRAASRAREVLGRMMVLGAPIRLTGLDALNAESGQKGGLGLAAEGIVGGLGALAVLAFVFGSLLAFVPLLIAFISVTTSFLLVWGLAELTSVSVLVEFLIALVGLGMAIDYSLLIVARWREEQASGFAGEEAIVRAIETAGRAVVFSGTTVAISLLALIALPLPFLRSVGYGGMLIPLVSVAVALTVLPVVLFKWGNRLAWPHRQRADTATRRWSLWVTMVVRHRIAAAVGAVAVVIALTVAATSMHLGASSGEPNSISQKGSARAGLEQLERSGLGTGVLTPVEILGRNLSSRQRVVADVAGVPGVRGVIGPSAWRRGQTYVVDAFPSSDARSIVDRVRDAVHRSGGRARVGGLIAQNDDFISATYHSFPVMIGVICLLTFVLLARALRSVVLPLKAVVLNLLSLGAAWGVLTLVWQHGWGTHALWGVPATTSIPSWLPLVIFAFLFGLSMDYEVFILSRIRESYDNTGSTDDAVVAGTSRTGRLVTSAAMVLFLGFVAMSTAPSTGIKMMATGLGAGILLDATVVRSMLVPAAVSLFGRWNWWLPDPLARLLRVTGTDRGTLSTRRVQPGFDQLPGI
jgi:RND superfamily putative drug exporter